MSALYGQIGESKPKALLAEPGGEVIGIPCAPGEGVIPAGRLMKRGEKGLYEEAADSDITAENYLVVLGQDVDVSVDKSISEDAMAYRSGTFVRGKVTVKSEGTIDVAKELILRTQGIVFDPIVSETTFNNEKDQD